VNLHVTKNAAGDLENVPVLTNCRETKDFDRLVFKDGSFSVQDSFQPRRQFDVVLDINEVNLETFVGVKTVTVKVSRNGGPQTDVNCVIVIRAKQ
jgi:hypothetical protein